MINLEIERSPMWSSLVALTQKRYELSYQISKTTDIEELANLEWEKKGIDEAIKILHQKMNNKKGTTEVAPSRNQSVTQVEPSIKEEE